MRHFFTFLFYLLGWKVRGNVPAELKKYILIVAPHTSNWDFFVGLAARSILQLDAKYLAKEELFRFPFGWIFKKLGGYPVVRSKSTNFVDAVVEIFNSKSEFSIAITPEGTRSYVPVWKTGFYYIARNAGIPIIKVALDYGNKEVVLEPPVFTTGNVEADIKLMMEYYKKIRGKNPDQGVL